jgi:hypothetical protein
MKGLATVLAALALVSCGGSPKPAAGVRPVSTPTAAPADLGDAASRDHAVEDCSTQSGAEFPDAFTSRANLVVGPFALIGGAYTDPETVREFGGNKFPLLVQAGHTVKLALAPDARRIAGLAYGPLPQGEAKMRDTYRSVTFIACRRGRSQSRGNGFEVTFWSGIVLTRKPACLPLDVSIDGAAPRRVALALGARCQSSRP